MEKRFPASLSLTSWVVSIAVMIFTAVMSVFIFRNIEDSDAPAWLVWAFPVFMSGTILGLFLYRPSAYMITPYSVVISRPAKDKVIDRKDIAVCRVVSKEEMGLPIRTFGNGGLFGFTGKYFSDRLGKMQWYCTRTDNYVLLQLATGNRLIITPDEPQAFVNALLKP